MPLIARVLLSLVGEVIFDVRASQVRGYESEIDRYLDERGFRRPRPASASPAK
jgi:hypothetical protein